MLNRNKVFVCAIVAMAGNLAACSGSGETIASSAPPTTNMPPPAPTYTPQPMQQADLSQHSVYFNLDQSEIKPDSQAVISNWANYRVAHPSVRVVVEGNCDERGTREYNVALGERRANAVAHALEAGGLSSTQVSTISYGKERPVALGHDETSWAQNRRADLIQK